MSFKKLEEEVKTLQKYLGGAIQMIKALKVSVEALEKRLDENENKEIKEIKDAQVVIEEILRENLYAIKRVDKELHSLGARKTNSKENKKEPDDKKDEEVEKKPAKKCRYYNRGFCKYTNKGCRFSHPRVICKEYLETRKCESKECDARHPKNCKWIR